MFSNYKNWLILKPLKDIYNTFKDGVEGFSYKKSASFFALYVAYKMSISITDDNIKKEVIFYWQTFSVSVIGIIAIPVILSIISGKFKKEETNKEEEK